MENPHLVDWYFSHRLTEFLRVFFDGILECDWRWHRFEWQSRTSIHAHGAARLLNDPGLINLTALVYKGRQAEKKIQTLLDSDENFKKLSYDIELGRKSGNIFIFSFSFLLLLVIIIIRTNYN